MGVEYLRLSGDIVDATLSPAAFVLTPQFLADTVLRLLREEEWLLPFGIRGFRECDVQFLLWRALLLQWRELFLGGYEASIEDKRADIAIRDDRKTLIATIELKGPWLAKKFRYPNEFADLCKTDFGKHLSQLSAGLSGQRYSLWVFTGENEETIQNVFDEFLAVARTAAPGCFVEPASSNMLCLSNPHPRWRKCRVYAVRVYIDSTDAAAP
jgi:hypothetical protein